MEAFRFRSFEACHPGNRVQRKDPALGKNAQEPDAGSPPACAGRRSPRVEGKVPGFFAKCLHLRNENRGFLGQRQFPQAGPETVSGDSGSAQPDVSDYSPYHSRPWARRKDTWRRHRAYCATPALQQQRTDISKW